MPDEQTVEARLRDAVKSIAKALEAQGVLREPALEIAKRHAERLYISPTNGTIRVTTQGGAFYPANAEDPFAHLIEELYRSVPVTDKAAVSAEDQAGAKKRLRHTGQY